MIAGAFALAAAPGQTQQLASIGSVSGVQPDAFGTPPGQTRRTLAIQTDVFSSERIETQKSAWAQIRFRDDTDFRVGGNSVVVLDRFVYDPQKKSGELVLNVGQGMFRFVTGTMNKDGYKIQTPSAVIGVRGTDLLLQVTPAGDTRVAVISGQVVITPLRAGGQLTVIDPNNQGGVDNGGNSVKVEPVPGDASGSSDKMTAWFDSDGSLGSGDGGSANGLSGAAQLRTLQMNPTPPMVMPPPSPPPAAPPPQMPGGYRKM
ncbi:MAG: FecR family protein [Alphaproteobacteria bacterium]